MSAAEPACPTKPKLQGWPFGYKTWPLLSDRRHALHHHVDSPQLTSAQTVPGENCVCRWSSATVPTMPCGKMRACYSASIRADASFPFRPGATLLITWLHHTRGARLRSFSSRFEPANVACLFACSKAERSTISCTPCLRHVLGYP